VTGRAWAVATVVTIVFAAGIGTATAEKLPSGGGGGFGLFVELDPSAGNSQTITMPDAATAALTVQAVAAQTEHTFRVQNSSGNDLLAVGRLGVVSVGDILDLASSAGFMRQSGAGVLFNDDIMPYSTGAWDIGQSSRVWQEGHIREAIPSNDAQSGADSGDGSPGTVTDDCITDYCECECLDGDDCNVTKTETGANVSRLQCWVTVGSNSCIFADQAGVLEVSGASITVDPGDGVCFRYTSDNEWHQVIAP